MASLTSTELSHLRRKTQRYRMYFVKWDTWQIRQTTKNLYNPLDPEHPVQLGTKTLADFDPIVNIGPNRMAFVGEAISFSATNSFKVHNGSITSTPEWNIELDSGTSTVSAWTTSATWNAPGLYEVTCTIDGATAQRYVRVFADRTSITYDVVSVTGLSGTTSGGWKAQIVIAPSDDEPGVSSQSISVGDFQAVGLFIEEEWVDTDGSVSRSPISGYQPDQRLLISGYVQQGSVHLDANNHNVSLTIGSVVDQMGIGYVNETVSFSQEYCDIDDAGPNKIDPYGVVFDINPLNIQDHLIYFLQKYTNVFERHDFTTWYDSSLQEMDTITVKGETAMWGAFGSLADYEWAWWFADPAGGIHFEPNPSIRSRGWFESQYPVRMSVTKEDLLKIDVNERKMRNVVFLQLTGTRTRDGRQWVVTYPGTKPKAGPGQWLIKNGLVVSRGSFLENIAEDVYADANRKFTANLTFPLNRAFRVPDRLLLTIDIPDRGISWVEKEFYVTQVGYNLNPAMGIWQTTVQVIETINTLHRSLTADGYIA